MSRIIGLDHGARRIGVAVGDTRTGLAFARPAIRARSMEAVLAEIVGLSSLEGAARVVIGLPLRMDGSEGHQARRAREFGAALAAAGLQVEFSDERLTSWAAGEELAARRRRAHRSGGEIDSTAARLILQQYLDALPVAPSARNDPAKETA